jgi:hypothetical protein
MEDKLLRVKYPLNQSILKIPQNEKVVPYVVNGNNPQLKNYGDYKDYRNKYPTYCNTLQPPPRDQTNFNKLMNEKRCAYLPERAFKNDECYFLESNPTGSSNGKVGGYFCGGTSNNNFNRGNEFGLDYPFDKPPVQDFNIPQQQPTELEYYDMNLNLRQFKNDYKLIETNPDYKSYPYNQSQSIVYRKGF